jgi:hypothetical protein
LAYFDSVFERVHYYVSHSFALPIFTSVCKIHTCLFHSILSQDNQLTGYIT